MTQYDDTVERQRLLLAAEEWANGIRSLHSHRLSSMWYDTRPQDTENGQFKLTGFALAGLSSLPLYFWKDAASRVIAILGHNVAYILQDIKNI